MQRFFQFRFISISCIILSHKQCYVCTSFGKTCLHYCKTVWLVTHRTLQETGNAFLEAAGRRRLLGRLDHFHLQTLPVHRTVLHGRPFRGGGGTHLLVPSVKKRERKDTRKREHKRKDRQSGSWRDGYMGAQKHTKKDYVN